MGNIRLQCLMLALLTFFARDCHTDNCELYLDLMKRCLTNMIYEGPDIYGQYNPSIRENGKDCPKTAHTMIGMKRLDNIAFCLKEILRDEIPGDCIETGVWKGGSTIFMRAILKAYGDTSRKVWVADSFEGVPPPNVYEYPADTGIDLYQCGVLSISLDEVKSNFNKYNLLDDQVVFLKGFFKDSLPTAPIKQIALLRLDGDLYESTMDALTNLYPKLSVGGYIIVDDYCMECCKRAVHDYRDAHAITNPILETPDHIGIYWRKTDM